MIALIYQGFAEGDFAMYITGPWNVGFCREHPGYFSGFSKVRGKCVWGDVEGKGKVGCACWQRGLSREFDTGTNHRVGCLVGCAILSMLRGEVDVLGSLEGDLQGPYFGWMFEVELHKAL